MFLTVCLIVTVALAGSTAPEIQPAPWPMQGYACVRTIDAIVIDGQLNDTTWAAAPWTAAFVDIEGDRQPAPRLHTRVKMLWDDEYFYFGAEMNEPHLWATLRERDSIIYYDNDFEIFIDPDGDTHLYSELEINAFNTVWDLLLIKPYRDGGPAIHAWDIPGLLTAVHLDGTLNDPSDEDRGWSTEIAIPWAVLRETTKTACPPAMGDRWRVNFSRVQWRLESATGAYRKAIDPATGKSYPENNWVWSAQREIAMHEPEHWGIVEFRENPGGPAVEPTLTDAAAWHLRMATYLIAAQRTEDGAWPDAFTAPALTAEGPQMGSDWIWPPNYRKNGPHYWLSLPHRDGGALIIDENGRLVRSP